MLCVWKIVSTDLLTSTSWAHSSNASFTSQSPGNDRPYLQSCKISLSKSSSIFPAWIQSMFVECWLRAMHYARIPSNEWTFIWQRPWRTLGRHSSEGINIYLKASQGPRYNAGVDVDGEQLVMHASFARCYMCNPSNEYIFIKHSVCSKHEKKHRIPPNYHRYGRGGQVLLFPFHTGGNSEGSASLWMITKTEIRNYIY